MPISPVRSLSVGLDALRANPLRTLLSTLGIVMGVGAMVSVLSMGDGVERFAREEIERTTDLLAVSVTPTAGTSVDGLFLRRPYVVRFTAADALRLAAEFPHAAKVDLITTGATFVEVGPAAAPRGFSVEGTLGTRARDAGYALAAGRWFGDSDTAVVVLASRAAGVVAGDSTRPAAALGRTLLLQGNAHRVIGVLALRDAEPGLQAFVPVDDAGRALAGVRNPALVLTAARIEDVDALRGALEAWAGRRYGPVWQEHVTIVNRRTRVEQGATAMRIFRLLMGAITGVSLLVGGVGIMNVLLAAVAERTREIGIRKATGARDRDILVQFLAESGRRAADLASPPSGPMSITQSASLITSEVVLDEHKERVWPGLIDAAGRDPPRQLRMSSRCRPVVGSSMMYSLRPLPSWPRARARARS
jgi:putative ABC transport system permease protein